MSDNTRIIWTDATWNPVTGCSPASEGCANCYAAKMAPRLKAMGLVKYAGGFKPMCHSAALSVPTRWRKPRWIFVDSMGDLFHEGIPEKFIQRVFEVMAATPQHTYQILTKRSERLYMMSPRIAWPPNVWMGVSVESDRWKGRIDDLQETGARVKFISFEPLLGPIGLLDIRGIGWCIVGGESGPCARPMEAEWAVSIVERCRTAGIPVFVKQMGSAWVRTHGDDFEENWPERLRVKEFPREDGR